MSEVKKEILELKDQKESEGKVLTGIQIDFKRYKTLIEEARFIVGNNEICTLDQFYGIRVYVSIEEDYLFIW